MSKITRRTMLAAGSTALMLPILEANAAPKKSRNSSSGIPKRLVFLPMGYGVNNKWFPSAKQVGTDYNLPPLLEPFGELKADFSILQNLSHRHKGPAHGGSTNWLTGANSKRGRTISCDQVVAKVVGRDTRFSSMTIGNQGRVDGHGGYASYGPDGKPIGLIRNMNSLYASLFGAPGKAGQVKQNLAREKSSLDAILGNAKRLTGHISSSDRDRVDEYFTAIRNMEKRLSKAEDWSTSPPPRAPFSLPKKASGKNQIETMLEMIRIGMQSDSSRVYSYMLPTQAFIKQIGGKNAHRMSHAASGSLHQKRDLTLSQMVADFLTNLKKTKEADGSSLLDHSLVVYGSALRSGHKQVNGPTMLAGHGGGGLKQGMNLVYKGKTPLGDLWVSIIRHMGVNATQFANSQRVMTELGFK